MIDQPFPDGDRPWPEELALLHGKCVVCGKPWHTREAVAACAKVALKMQPPAPSWTKPLDERERDVDEVWQGTEGDVDEVWNS